MDVWKGRGDMHTGFRRENLKAKDHSKNLREDGLIWLRTGTTEFSGCCEHGFETSGSIKSG